MHAGQADAQDSAYTLRARLAAAARQTAAVRGMSVARATRMCAGGIRRCLMPAVALAVAQAGAGVETGAVAQDWEAVGVCWRCKATRGRCSRRCSQMIVWPASGGRGGECTGARQ